jgi:hypothetical protein
MNFTRQFWALLRMSLTAIPQRPRAGAPMRVRANGAIPARSEEKSQRERTTQPSEAL